VSLWEAGLTPDFHQSSSLPKGVHLGACLSGCLKSDDGSDANHDDGLPEELGFPNAS